VKKHRAKPKNDSYEKIKFLTLQEAMAGPDADNWKEAMKVEYDSLMEYGTWEMVDLPPGRKAIGNKWVFVRKKNPDGTDGAFKARLVAQGFTQIEGVDFFDTFAPVARISSVRIGFALATQFNLEIRQLDIKSAYLNGIMEEEIFMQQPKMFSNGKNEVCLLKRGLYGTKQAGRIWNKEIDKTLSNSGWKRTIGDNCVYLQGNVKSENFKMLVIYVDDILIFHPAKITQRIDEIVKELAKIYKLRDMGTIEKARYLGASIKQNRKLGKLEISQSTTIKEVVERFGLENAKAISTPMDNAKILCSQESDSEEGTLNRPYRSAIGSMMYPSNTSRPDISYAVGILSRYLEKPKERHWTAAMRVLKYLKGTADLALIYEKCDQKQFELTGFADSDWAGDVDTSKSVGGYAIYLGNCLVGWKSKRRQNVATSTTTAEIDSLYVGVIEGIWMKNFLKELGLDLKTVKWYQDNQSAIKTLNSEKNMDKTRHELVKIHYLREKVRENEIEIHYAATKEMIADIFTKPLNRGDFERQRNRLGLRLSEMVDDEKVDPRRNEGKKRKEDEECELEGEC
jgi:hypothetical protein